jgi:NAD+ kinase
MQVCLFGLSANPPGVHHRKIALKLAKMPVCDKVIVIPCGGRPDKLTTNDIDPVHRAAMVDMTFAGIPKVEVDNFDLGNVTYTPAIELQARYGHLGQVWHFVGPDLVKGGASGESPIQKTWKDGVNVFGTLNFIVGYHPRYKVESRDWPKNSQGLPLDFSGRSRLIREKVFSHQSIEGLVVPRVAQYIERYGLYRGGYTNIDVPWQMENPQIAVVADKTNVDAEGLARFLEQFVSNEPDLLVVIGGDGFMLQTIRAYHERRIPFFGINVGHRGFLLNNVMGRFLPEVFSQPMFFYHQPFIKVEIERPNGETQNHLAFNDAWVQVEPGKTAWIRVKVNDETYIDRLVSDGALVATTAGSGAYARSMGARPLPVKGLVLVGNNVMEPADWKMAQLPLGATVEFENIDPTKGDKRPILGFTDGIGNGKVKRMKLRVSQIAAAELAFLPEFRLERKLISIQRPERGN